MSLTQEDLKKIKALIREEFGDEISKNNLVLFELFEKHFVTKEDLKSLWEKACEKFATKEQLTKVQDLVVMIKNKLDTECKFIQKRGEENTERIDEHEKEIQDLIRLRGIPRSQDRGMDSILPLRRIFSQRLICLWHDNSDEANYQIPRP